MPLEFLCNPNEMTGRLMARRRTLTTALAVATVFSLRVATRIRNLRSQS